MSILLLLLSLYIYYIINYYINSKKSDFISNTESNINSLKKNEGKFPFSFAFMSDTENSDNSLWLIKNLLESNIDFFVFVGDIVNDSIKSEHRLFYQNVSRFSSEIPVFIVPSNHDIKDGEFCRSDFEKIYGPVNFNFTYNNCLFIFISNIDQEDIKAKDYLESILSNRSSKIKYTFVFCSTPLRIVLSKVLDCPLWISEFDRIIDKYKVDYVISGDYHKHLELTDDNKIQHIVSGSGGAHFIEKTPFGRFKNGTKITVYPDAVMREIVVCDKKIILTDNSIRRFIYNKFGNELSKNIILLNVIAVFSIINVLFSSYLFIKRIEL